VGETQYSLVEAIWVIIDWKGDNVMLSSPILEGTPAQIAKELGNLSSRKRYRVVEVSEERSELPLEEEEALLNTLASQSKMPVLPSVANSREWIYEER